MKKIFSSLFNFIAIMVMSNMAVAAAFEWSDISYLEGRYSRIYFDYQQQSGNGTFYVINDWMVNQDDGGVNGGLNPDEYNLFPFTLGADEYEIRIYGDGSSDIFRNGVNDPNSLMNFRSAFNWTVSPNEPDVDHTIWEFSFDVAPNTRIRRFVGKDPAVPMYIYDYPATPSIITSGPSQYDHFIDGTFSDVLASPTLAPDPTRPYLEPVQDPWFEPREIVIDLNEGGGTTITTIPLPPALLLFVTGLAGMAAYKKVTAVVHKHRC